MKFAVVLGLAASADAQMGPGFFPPRGLYGFSSYMAPNSGAYNFNNNFQALSSTFQNFVSSQNFGNGVPASPSIHSAAPINMQQQMQQQMPLNAYGMRSRFNYGPWGYGGGRGFPQQFGNQFQQRPGFGYRPTGLGGNPNTWGPPLQPQQPTSLGGNPNTWGPPLQPQQPTSFGGNPNTWGPPLDYEEKTAVTEEEPAEEEPAEEEPAEEEPAEEEPAQEAAAGPTMNLAASIAGSPVHQTLAAIVTSEAYSDILAALTGDDKLTVFAPTDDAFNKVGLTKETFGQAPVDVISYVLLHHAVPGVYMAGDLAEGSNEVTTAAGTTMTIVKTGDSVCIDNGETQSCVTMADGMAINGVYHVVDEVLRAPAPEEEQPKKKKKKNTGA